MASGYPTPKHQWQTTPHSQTMSSFMPPKPQTLSDLFNNQFFLGFQEQIDRWNSLTNVKVTTFPPYNLIKVDENNYTIEIAVAGYTKSDIDIVVEKDLLTVKSLEKSEESETTVLHQGIAKRLWTQQFVLGEWMSVKDAVLKDGLLTIKVEREVPEELKPKSIKIK